MLQKARIVPSIAGFVLFFAAFPGVAQEVADARALVRVSIVLFDVDAQAVYACADRANLTAAGVLACAAHDPGLLVLLADSNGGTPLGWQETTVYKDSITKTCGWYRAQLGHTACKVSFEGGRRVNAIWLYHCDCSDSQAEFLTSGVPHNYLDGGCNGCFSGMYHTFQANKQVGLGDPMCNDETMSGGGGFTGATGTIGPSGTSNCPTDLNGVWGIGVNYEKAMWGGDRKVKSSHQHQFTYTGG